jgi:hypothetical protein
VTNLDKDNILRRGDTTDPDIEEFVAGIHYIEQEVRERMELTRQWIEQDADKRRRDMPTSLHPGAYAYMSTNGITLPWDKERRSKKLRQLYCSRASKIQYRTRVILNIFGKGMGIWKSQVCAYGQKNVLTFEILG